MGHSSGRNAFACARFADYWCAYLAASIVDGCASRRPCCTIPAARRIRAFLTHALPDPDGFRHPNARHPV